jgi:hypothetical protein
MQRLCIYTRTILKLRYGIGVGSDELDLRILGTWFFWIMKMGDRFQGPFTNVISLPLNKILQFSLNDS